MMNESADRCIQLGECIGKGATATVFRGLNLSTGETLAIKQFRRKDVSAKQTDDIMVTYHWYQQVEFIYVY